MVKFFSNLNQITPRNVTWKDDFNDSAIFASKIVPLMYIDTTRCFTYNPPEPSKARWGGEVITNKKELKYLYTY